MHYLIHADEGVFGVLYGALPENLNGRTLQLARYRRVESHISEMTAVDAPTIDHYSFQPSGRNAFLVSDATYELLLKDRRLSGDLWWEPLTTAPATGVAFSVRPHGDVEGGAIVSPIGFSESEMPSCNLADYQGGSYLLSYVDHVRQAYDRRSHD